MNVEILKRLEIACKEAIEEIDMYAQKKSWTEHYVILMVCGIPKIAEAFYTDKNEKLLERICPFLLENIEKFLGTFSYTKYRAIRHDDFEVLTEQRTLDALEAEHANVIKSKPPHCYRTKAKICGIDIYAVPESVMRYIEQKDPEITPLYRGFREHHQEKKGTDE